MDAGLARAQREALKSVEQFRLGAAVVHRSTVVATGHNRNMNACGLYSIHAEMDALWKARKRWVGGARLVVVRVLKDGSLGCSRPCPACTAALARRGIRKVTYTTGDSFRPLETLTFQRGSS